MGLNAGLVTSVLASVGLLSSISVHLWAATHPPPCEQIVTTVVSRSAPRAWVCNFGVANLAIGALGSSLLWLPCVLYLYCRTTEAPSVPTAPPATQRRDHRPRDKTPVPLSKRAANLAVDASYFQ